MKNWNCGNGNNFDNGTRWRAELSGAEQFSKQFSQATIRPARVLLLLYQFSTPAALPASQLFIFLFLGRELSLERLGTLLQPVISCS